MRGRRRTRLSEKQARGIHAGDRDKRLRPYAQPGEPTPPPTLTPESRAVWRELLRMLRPLEVITPADAVAFGLLCEELAELRRLRRILNDKGSTLRVKTKYGSAEWARTEVKQADAVWRRVERLLRQFGMTPAARRHVHTAPIRLDQTEESLESYLARGKPAP